MLMKIGDASAQFGISRKSLRYWEGAGILHSARGENDYRYYGEEDVQKIRQIVLLRKLRFSIPDIQAIFESADLQKIIAVFAAHLDETRQEKKQLQALGTVLQTLLRMVQDRQDINTVYQYLESAQPAESEELKEALKTLLSEQPKEIAAAELPPEPLVDMRGVDLSLEPLSAQDIPELEAIIRRCYAKTREKDMAQLLFFWDFNGLRMQDCRWFYKIMQNGEPVGAVNLAMAGMEAMLIRCLAYSDPANNVYLFELLKQKHPDILCWNLYFPNAEKDKGDFCFDWAGKKKRFAEDNGFTFYTDARWNRWIKMLQPHDAVYNSSRYRFALLDGSMDGISFRFFGTDKLDWYDGKMTNWSVTDCDFSGTLLYDTWMGNSRFYDSNIDHCDFRYTNFVESSFEGGSFENCKFNGCNITGMTIDGINVADALAAWREKQ